MYIAPLQNPYSEALPTPAKRKRTVLRRWWNWEPAPFGRCLSLPQIYWKSIPGCWTNHRKKNGPALLNGSLTYTDYDPAPLVSSRFVVCILLGFRSVANNCIDLYYEAQYIGLSPSGLNKSLPREGSATLILLLHFFCHQCLLSSIGEASCLVVSLRSSIKNPITARFVTLSVLCWTNIISIIHFRAVSYRSVQASVVPWSLPK